ncbi:homogentisate phytyltransferase [Lewinellaceae bacterium SD302]|nr:homogentisate phytyltransferase [Lewinellaceae bacterium SD302]
MLTFLRFARAHTIIGTSLSIICLYVLAARLTGEYDIWLLLLTLLSCLAANVYITGLNQLTDVEIDKINKPYLPLASGAYSIRTGRNIVIVSLIISIIVALLSTRFLITTVLLSLLIGTAYSLPPLRLKRFPFWAAFCILAVRGLLVNLLLYLHFQFAFNGGTAIPTVVWLLTAIIFAFSIIIAWYKDLPDTAGDAAYDIDTLSLRIGRQSVWRMGAWLLSLVFIIGGGLAYYYGYSALAVGQLALLLGLALAGSRLDLQNQQSIARYYQSIWILFFLEYSIFALLG